MHAFIAEPPDGGSGVAEESFSAHSHISSDQMFEQESNIWKHPEENPTDLPISHCHILGLQEICPSNPTYDRKFDKSTSLLRPSVRFLSKIGRTLLGEHYRRLMSTSLSLNGVASLEIPSEERKEKRQYLERTLPPAGVALGSLRYRRKDLDGIYSSTCEKEGCCYQPDSFLSLSKHLKKGHYRMASLLPHAEGQLDCLKLPSLYYPVNPARMRDPLICPKPIHFCSYCDTYFSSLGDIQKHFALLHSEKLFDPRVTGLLKHCSHCQELVQRDSSLVLVCKIPVSPCPPDVAWNLIDRYLKFDIARSISAHPLASLLLFPNPQSPLSLPEPLARIVSKRCSSVCSVPNDGTTRFLTAISAIRGCLHPIYMAKYKKDLENSLNLDDLICINELSVQTQNVLQSRPLRSVCLLDKQANESYGTNGNATKVHESSSSPDSSVLLLERRLAISRPTQLGVRSSQGKLPVLVWNPSAATSVSGLRPHGSTVGSVNVGILPKPSCRSSVIRQDFSPFSHGDFLKIAPKSNLSNERMLQYEQVDSSKPKGLSSTQQSQDFKQDALKSDVLNGSKESEHRENNSLQIKIATSSETFSKASKSLLVSRQFSDSSAAHILRKLKKTTKEREGSASRDSAIDDSSILSSSATSVGGLTPCKRRKTSSPSHSPEATEHAPKLLIIDSRRVLIHTPKNAQLADIPLNTKNSLPGTKVFSKLLKRAGDVLEQSVLSSEEEHLNCNVNLRVSSVLESAAKILARAKLPPVLNMPSNLWRDSLKKPRHSCQGTFQQESSEQSATETEDSECRPDALSREVGMGNMMCPVCSFVGKSKEEIINHILAKH